MTTRRNTAGQQMLGVEPPDRDNGGHDGRSPAALGFDPRNLSMLVVVVVYSVACLLAERLLLGDLGPFWRHRSFLYMGVAVAVLAYVATYATVAHTSVTRIAFIGGMVSTSAAAALLVGMALAPLAVLGLWIFERTLLYEISTNDFAFDVATISVSLLAFAPLVLGVTLWRRARQLGIAPFRARRTRITWSWLSGAALALALPLAASQLAAGIDTRIVLGSESDRARMSALLDDAAVERDRSREQSNRVPVDVGAHTDLLWVSVAPNGNLVAAMKPCPDTLPAFVLCLGEYGLYVWDRRFEEPRLILRLREGDPGSGVSFWYGWTPDSNALVIEGWGQGEADRVAEFPLVYLVDEDTWHTVEP